jgi:hypothetical protein
MIRRLRWISLVPACIAAWYVALFTGIFLHGILFSYCPQNLVAYGMFCDAEWFPAAERSLMCFGAALSAVLVVLTAAAMAPTHKITVARVALAVGAVVAVIMAIHIGKYAEFISAVFAGALAALAVDLLLRRYRSRSVDVA